MCSNFTDAVFEVFEKISKANNKYQVKNAKRTIFYLAGGTAVHFYTNARVSEDIDVIIGQYKPDIPQDLGTTWIDEHGDEMSLYYDENYTETLGLLSEDYEDRAIKLKDIDDNIELYVLHPIDLVITKLARYSDSDQEDIKTLIQLDFFNIIKFEELARQALRETPHVSSSRGVNYHIDDVIEEYFKLST